jgi:hypothetical protein
LKKNENSENTNSERVLIEKKEKKVLEDNDNDYILDKMDFNELIKEKNKEDENRVDRRTIIQMLISVVKNNSTIIYAFSQKHKDDFFLRSTILILCISFYICLNVFLVFNMSMVKVYTNFKFGYCSLNIFIPCIVSLPIIIIKKFMSMKELFYRALQYQKNKINKTAISNNKNNKDTKEEEIIKEIEIYQKYFEKATYIYGAFGIIFFVFNCVLLTSFCGIYPNSVSKLAINTIVSIIGSSVIIIIFYLIGVIIRYFSLKNEDEMLYIISRIFNPLNLSCNDIKKMTCKRGNKKRGQNLFNNPENQ